MFVVLELKVVVMALENVRMQLPMRGWDGPMKEKTLINMDSFTKLI